MGNWSIKKTDEREDRIRRLMRETGENTKAGAIDVAMKHYLADLYNKREAIRDLDPELVELLSRPYLPMNKEVNISIGQDGE